MVQPILIGSDSDEDDFLTENVNVNIPSQGGKLNSDAIDHEAEGYIRVINTMASDAKRPMKWISSLPITLVMKKSLQGRIGGIDALIQSSLISKWEADWILKRQISVYAYLKANYDAILFSVYGENEAHWSLLVWYIGRKKGFWHYDSLKSRKVFVDTNVRTACDIIHFLGWNGVIPETSYGLRMPKWVPSQPGGWECGHYVLITVFAMCVQYARDSDGATNVLDESHAQRYSTETIMSLWNQYAQ